MIRKIRLDRLGRTLPLLLLLFHFTHLGFAADPWPKIQREQVMARVAAEALTWRQQLPAQRPRLFFSPQQWRDLRARFVGAKGREREWFDLVITEAQKLARKPVAVYRSPLEAAQGGPVTFDMRQQLWQRPVGDNMVLLSLALALQDNNAVRKKLHETVLAACRYPQWGDQWPNQDLACGHIARGIAIAYDWHPELWTEPEKSFIRETIRARLNADKAGAYGGMFWANAYDANHNHVNNAALGLCGLAFLDEIPEAAEWTALALTNFENVMRYASPDGSSSEGVPYWSYALSFILQYIEGTRNVLGTAELYHAPFLRHALSYRINASTPGFGATLPWGDAPSEDYYGPQQIAYRLAAEYREQSGQYLANHVPFGPNGGADCLAFTALWYDPTLSETRPEILDYHASTIDLATTRSGWSSSDYLLAVKSGFTNRNHSHLDAGAIAWSSGGEWLIGTPGYGQVDAAGTFWQTNGPRWKFFSNSTESHSTLLIDGRNQRFNAEARGTIDSFVSTASGCWMSIDLTPAYEGAKRVRRDILHRRGQYALVLDDVEMSAPKLVEWLVQVPAQANVAGPRITIAGKTGSLELRAILPSLSFAPHPRYSPFFDVAAGRLKSVSLRQESQHSRFAVALLPNADASHTSHLKIRGEESPDGSKFVVTGDGWEDDIVVDESSSATARITITSRLKNKVDSVVALGARAVRWNESILHFERPADLSLQATASEEIVLDLTAANRLIGGTETNWQVLPNSDNAGPTELAPRVDLPSGKFRLRRLNESPNGLKK